jgi:hypothetical protein
VTGLLTRLACGATALIAVGTIAACGGQKSTSTTSPPSTTTTTTAAPATSATSPSSTPAASTVVFEVTGTGQALTIDTDPSPPDQNRWYDQPLPWQRSTTIGSDVSLLQVVAVGKDNTQPGCRITLDGKVVAEEPIGGSAHCTYQRP